MKFWVSNLALISICCGAASGMWPFPPKRFTGNSLLEAGHLGLDTDGRVVAFGDFNGDQFLDVLSLGSDQQTLTIYLWDHVEFTFKTASVFKHPENILNVVPGDFTQNGKLDLLVMSQSGLKNQLNLFMYLAHPEGGLDTNPLSLPPSTQSQPIAFDLNGDLKIDMLGIPLSTANDPAPFRVWQNVWNESEPRGPVFEIVNSTFQGSQCQISNPHSNAIVDMNGDCLADVFLVCDEENTGNKYFQIWINQKKEGFKLHQLGRLPSGFQSVSFVDVDRDGTIDMVFSTCASVSSSTGIGTDCAINIAYNQQLPLCTSTTTPSVKNGKRVCRTPEQLCIADPNFLFNLDESAENDAFVRIPIKDIFPTPFGGAPPTLLVFDTTHNPPLPIPLKLADLNLDGFPDLVPIIVSTPAGGRSKQDRTPKILNNVPCAKNIAGCGPEGNGRRGWSELKKGASILDGVKDARGIAFLDLDEDGTLDIMVQRSGEQGQGNIFFVQNNFYYDAFFLKAIVLNGACNSGWCYPKNGTRFHPYGVSYSGATYKYTVLDTSGRRTAAEVSQLPQTAYHSLLTPYSFFGLGRTNNYIENLFVGSTKHTDEHFINMEGVVPNSKVVIIPPPGDSDSWKKELYLRPGEWIPLVTLTVVIATILLAVIVFMLHLNEKREDEQERRKVSHHINFDAL